MTCSVLLPQWFICYTYFLHYYIIYKYIYNCSGCSQLLETYYIYTAMFQITCFYFLLVIIITVSTKGTQSLCFFKLSHQQSFPSLFCFHSQCLAWSWYLANDMQFFIISPLFLFFMYRSVEVHLNIPFAFGYRTKPCLDFLHYCPFIYTVAHFFYNH